MANADTMRGFTPIKNIDGTPFNGATIKCALLVADATATFIGDAVTLSGTASAEGYPSVQQAAASDTQIFGVVTSFDAAPTDLETQYRKASTLRLCNVVPAGSALFKIQSDGATDITDVGRQADITVGSGSTVSGLSAMELDHSNLGTGANLTVIGFDERPDNEIAAADVDVIVRINESWLHGTTAAI